MGQILLFTMLSGVAFVVQVMMYRSSKWGHLGGIARRKVCRVKLN